MNAFIVELPNQPGSLAMLADAVAGRGINITGFAGATSGELGSVAFTTDDDSGTRSDEQTSPSWVTKLPLLLQVVFGMTAFVSGMDGDKVEVSFGVDSAEAAQRALG